MGWDIIFANPCFCPYVPGISMVESHDTGFFIQLVALLAHQGCLMERNLKDILRHHEYTAEK